MIYSIQKLTTIVSGGSPGSHNFRYLQGYPPLHSHISSRSPPRLLKVSLLLLFFVVMFFFPPWRPTTRLLNPPTPCLQKLWYPGHLLPSPSVTITPSTLASHFPDSASVFSAPLLPPHHTALYSCILNTQELIDLIKVAKGGDAKAAKGAWMAIANYHQALTDTEVDFFHKHPTNAHIDALWGVSKKFQDMSAHFQLPPHGNKLPCWVITKVNQADSRSWYYCAWSLGACQLAYWRSVPLQN